MERTAGAKTKGLVRKCMLERFCPRNVASLFSHCVSNLTSLNVFIGNDEDPSSLSRKKVTALFFVFFYLSHTRFTVRFDVTVDSLHFFLQVRGTDCCTWSPPPCVSLVTSAQDV